MRDFLKVGVLSTLMTLGVIGSLTLVPKDAEAKCRIPMDAAGNPILPIPDCALPPQPDPTLPPVPVDGGGQPPEPQPSNTPTFSPDGTPAPVPGN